MPASNENRGRALIIRAAAYAGEAHVWQKRKTTEEPYVTHLLRVSFACEKAGLSDEAVAAALLHDTVEDTDVTFEELSHHFPDRVVELVRLLTQWWPDNAPLELKRSYFPKYFGALAKDPEAVAIKLFDRADNLNDMHRALPLTRVWAIRYLERTEEEISPLLESCDCQPAKDAYLHALRRLRGGLTRLARAQKKRARRVMQRAAQVSQSRRSGVAQMPSRNHRLHH